MLFSYYKNTFYILELSGRLVTLLSQTNKLQEKSSMHLKIGHSFQQFYLQNGFELNPYNPSFDIHYILCYNYVKKPSPDYI